METGIVDREPQPSNGGSQDAPQVAVTIKDRIPFKQRFGVAGPDIQLEESGVIVDGGWDWDRERADASHLLEVISSAQRLRYFHSGEFVARPKD